MILDDIGQLSHGSGIKIRVQCEKCNDIRFMEYRTAIKSLQRFNNTLCKSCRNTGEGNPFFNKKHRDETKKILSEKLSGENHPNFGKPRPIELILSGEKHPMFGVARPDMAGENNPMKKQINRDRARENMLKNNPMKNPEIVSKFKGENHWSWKSPETRKQNLNKQIRTMTEYKKWKTAVLERDSFSCQECGCKENLQVDHICALSDMIKKFNIQTKEQAASTSKLWDINNGKTLCAECHRKTRSYGKKKHVILYHLQLLRYQYFYSIKEAREFLKLTSYQFGNFLKNKCREEGAQHIVGFIDE